jgi:NAD(P)-dependent dehydrogenase (short-subunit alcohol dehydrogenase family)
VLVDRDEAPLVELARRLSVPSSSIAVDLTDANAPKRIRDHVIAKHKRLHVLVNNAGARWTAPFAEGGWENVRRTMAINFDAAVRLTARGDHQVAHRRALAWGDPTHRRGAAERPGSNPGRRAPTSFHMTAHALTDAKLGIEYSKSTTSPITSNGSRSSSRRCSSCATPGTTWSLSRARGRALHWRTPTSQ